MDKVVKWVVKWGIFLKIIPFTVLFLLAKLGIHLLKIEIWSFDLLAASLLGATTFLIAFALNNTIDDYRYSETLPLEVSNILESINDTNEFAGILHPEYNPQPLKNALIAFSNELLNNLEENMSLESVINKINSFNYFFADLDKYIDAPLMSRLQSEEAKLRFLVRQIQRLRDTNFIEAAYAILEILTGGASLALLFISSDNFPQNLVISALVFSVFIYLLVLISDLDNPFEYHNKSSADVDLIELKITLKRLESFNYNDLNCKKNIVNTEKEKKE